MRMLLDLLDSASPPGTFTVFDIAPEKNGWIAAIIRMCPVWEITLGRSGSSPNAHANTAHVCRP